MTAQDYVQELQRQLKTGNAREHSYRPALKQFFESLSAKITAINEPNRSEYGAPDFIFRDKKNELIYGYAETKDIYVDLNTIEKSSQLKRYLGYNNLIVTNYLEFHFFKNGEKYQSIVVAKQDGQNLIQQENNLLLLEQEIRSFLQGKPQPITNAKRLAQIMGGKAFRIRMNVEKYFQVQNERNAELLRIYEIMKKLLVHDLEVNKFADMYAQTLVYGLFVARYYDTSPENFSRQEARDLIPASNPFLQEFFDHIIGPKFDKRLGYIVDELCEVFKVSNVQAIIKKHYNLSDETSEKDPIIHFYEDFLTEYDPILRKQMGAYYTPIPVVRFIISSVDHVLKKEFLLSQGIASTEKITLPIIAQGKNLKDTFHKVQILDPAVGTATFLNEIIKSIHKEFQNQEGLWKSYVNKELLPRLYGFELMMAPYTIAHLKLAMTLKETGVDSLDQRLGVFLTNTMEEGIKVNDDLFSFGLAEAISKEAQAAIRIKHDKPIMVVIGNPPYSGESSNKGDYAMKLIEKYKYEPGGEEKLKERNPKWINDDYVKFIAFAQEMVTKNGEGVVAMITNHGYLDNPTFRGMRWNLIKTFDTIYVLDLHGNAKKKEVSPDGSKDENVFDIQQGVSIIIAIKKTSKKKLADVYRADKWGKRSVKFEYLSNNSIQSVKWDKIHLNEPMYFFIRRNETEEKEYQQGIKINELFPVNNVGIVTSRDSFVIDDNKTNLIKRISDFINGSMNNAEAKLFVKESERFTFTKARKTDFIETDIQGIQYRPFDDRFIYYKDYFIERSRKDLMHHFLKGNNVGLLIKRQGKQDFSYAFLTNKIAESCVFESAYANNTVCPLYLYPKNSQSDFFVESKRQPNLNMVLVKQILASIGKYKWVDDHENKKTKDETIVSPLDILDYVYAVLHSSSYRKKYKDFLKSDFPRVPVARDLNSFWDLVNLGSQLRKLHLMEGIEPLPGLGNYPIISNNKIDNLSYKQGKVYINDTQYFDNVPMKVWEFYIGGYQPAQKWLKDRKGKQLDFEKITHYQKIIAVLNKTIELMEKIDQV